MKSYLRWVPTMLGLSEEKRQGWVEKILDSFRSYRKGGKESGEIFLSDALENEDEFSRIGFAANVTYVKDHLGKGDAEDDLEVVFVHPLGSPALLYKHKRLPILIIASPGLRLNEQIESKDGRISRAEVRGITG